MSAIGGAVGGLVGTFAGQGDKNNQEKLMREAIATGKGYNTQAAGQGGTQFANMDPTARNSMLQAMADYQNKAKQGGLDAAGRARLAQGVAGGEQAAAASANQIQNEAARRGAAQGPASMVAQQVAAQQGAQRAQAGGLEAGAIAEAGQRQALQGQLGAAGQIAQGDRAKAAAADAINRFNVENAQKNIGNAYQQAGLVSGLQSGGANMYGQRAAATAKQFGDIGSGIGGIADFGMGGGFKQVAGMFAPSTEDQRDQ